MEKPRRLCKKSQWTRRVARNKRARAWKKWRRERAWERIVELGAEFIRECLGRQSLSKDAFAEVG